MTETNESEDRSSFITPEKNVSQPICSRSSECGWSRAFSKYSPSTEASLSPLKASQINLQTVLKQMTEKYIDICSWIVNMSEQFFYDNTLLLLNGSKTDTNKTKKVLRRNYKRMDLKFFENLEDVVLLGKGAYGSVYKCTDGEISKQYAIKFIAPKSKNFVTHCKSILNYLVERNSTVQAMDSPFVVKFYYSLHTKSIGGLFLFFEYCIGDFYAYIGELAPEDFLEISVRIYENEKGLIQSLDEELELLDVSLMYIFELFCALDFLMQVNIIHQDIKPENLMVSETLHLKIGDFGLAYRTRTIYRDSNKLLLTHSDIDSAESSNYALGIEGSDFYQDFEIKLMQLDREDSPTIDEVTNNRTLFNTPGIRYDEEILQPTFLTDTWAAGVVAVNLLFRGFDLFDPAIKDVKIWNDVPQSSNGEYLVHLVGRQSIYQKYVYGGLVNAGGECHKELMEFIASIFLPRQTRASEYVKEKTIRRFSKKRIIKYVDLEKIETIKSFKERKFNSKNVFLFSVPEKIRAFFTIEESIVYPTFKKLLGQFSRSSFGNSVIDLSPGLTINNF